MTYAEKHEAVRAVILMALEDNRQPGTQADIAFKAGIPKTEIKWVGQMIRDAEKDGDFDVHRPDRAAGEKGRDRYSFRGLEPPDDQVAVATASKLSGLNPDTHEWNLPDGTVAVGFGDRDNWTSFRAHRETQERERVIKEVMDEHMPTIYSHPQRSPEFKAGWEDMLLALEIATGEKWSGAERAKATIAEFTEGLKA